MAKAECSIFGRCPKEMHGLSHNCDNCLEQPYVYNQPTFDIDPDNKVSLEFSDSIAPYLEIVGD